jgi:hypothetical protein
MDQNNELKDKIEELREEKEREKNKRLKETFSNLISKMKDSKLPEALQEENEFLKNENDLLKQALKDQDRILDDVKRDRRSKARRYKTESMSLDYLRPRDLNEGQDNDIYVNDNDDNEGPITLAGSRLRGAQRDLDDQIDDSGDADEEPNPIDVLNEEKRRAERTNRALKRIRRSQLRRQKEEEERNSVQKSIKIEKLADDLEDNMRKRDNNEQRKDTYDDNSRDTRKQRPQKRSRGGY